MLRTTIFAMVTMASFCLSPITQANESQEAKVQATDNKVSKGRSMHYPSSKTASNQATNDKVSKGRSMSYPSPNKQ